MPSVFGVSRNQHLFAWCLELCLLGQTLSVNSVNHFSPPFLFSCCVFFFFPSSHISKSTFNLFPQSSRSSSAAKCYREAVASHYTKKYFTIFWRFFSSLFFPVTTQSLNYSVVCSPDSEHQVKAGAA